VIEKRLPKFTRGELVKHKLMNFSGKVIKTIQEPKYNNEFFYFIEGYSEGWNEKFIERAN
jgi:heat shock protein HspQ